MSSPTPAHFVRSLFKYLFEVLFRLLSGSPPATPIIISHFRPLRKQKAPFRRLKERSALAHFVRTLQVLFWLIWPYASTFSMFFPLLCLHRRDIPLMREKSRFFRVQTSQRIAIANISRRKRPAWCTNRAGGPSEMEKTAWSSFFSKKNSGFVDK